MHSTRLLLNLGFSRSCRCPDGHASTAALAAREQSPDVVEHLGRRARQVVNAATELVSTHKAYIEASGPGLREELRISVCCRKGILQSRGAVYRQSGRRGVWPCHRERRFGKFD